MHIEPGFVAHGKVAIANAAAAGLVAFHARQILRTPSLFVRILAAATFFSLFMQAFHAPVGPSEIHLVGASAIYFSLGFIPTLLGFPLGLLLQGIFFEPGDLYHLAVNSLSLMLPLLAVHYGARAGRYAGQGDAVLSLPAILRFDALYYGGVTLMVGFWLSLADVATPFAAWLTWAAAYAPVALAEPLLAYGLLKLIRRAGKDSLVARLFVAHELRLA